MRPYLIPILGQETMDRQDTGSRTEPTISLLNGSIKAISNDLSSYP